MEAVMPEQSSLHVYLNWAKERIDEMDAALASFEAKASQANADLKPKVDQLIVDLKKRRDEFQASLKSQAEAGETAWTRAKADMETQWNGFESQVKTYFETVSKQIEQQQATFKDIAAAQAKAWREATDKLHDAGSKVAAARRADVEAALKQMKSDASEADAPAPENQAGGKRVVVRAERGTGGVAQGFRSGQSGCVGCIEIEGLRHSEVLSLGRPF
jgi:hypothetical protein